MTLAGSLRDAWLVARFEVVRAVRTWRALALVLVYLIANGGGIYLFIQGIAAMERSLARSLGVATTERPGALLDQLRQGEDLPQMLEVLTGNPETAARLIDEPLLAVYQLWLGILFLPFLGATASAETLSADVRTRAVRFEALRTGRGELVLGRFLGQVLLTGGATVLAIVAAWSLGLGLMTGQQPLTLLVGLTGWGGRAALFAFPFVGLGLACSQWTSSPMWARVMALGLTAGSWILYGWTSWVEASPWVIVADVVAPVLPQTWIGGLWAGGVDLLVSALACVALGLGAVGLGFVRFGARDL